MVTRLVNELEAHLGVRLMNRTTRTVTLTAAGERYVEQARRLLQDLDDIESETALATTDLSGRLRVQVPHPPSWTNMGAPLIPATIWRSTWSTRPISRR